MIQTASAVFADRGQVVYYSTLDVTRSRSDVKCMDLGSWRRSGGSEIHNEKTIYSLYYISPNLT